MRKNSYIKYIALVLSCVYVSASTTGLGKEGGNAFEVTKLSSDRYHVQISINSYQLEEGTSIACHLPGAVLNQQDDAIPAYSRVIELDSGRSANIESMSQSKDSLAIESELFSLNGDQQVLDATVGRMGKRTFLRLGVNPFIHRTAGVLEVNTSIDAIIRIGEEQSTAKSNKRASQLESVSSSTGCLTCPVPMVPYVTEGNGIASDFVSRRSVTSGVAWKIYLSESSLYQITGDDLAAAGVPPAARDTTLIKISTQDEDVPVWTSTSGPMQSNDWIKFYGSALDSIYTTQNVYWLSIEGSAPPVSTIDATPMGSASTVSSTWSVVEYSPRDVFKPRYRPQEDMDNWFAMFNILNSSSNVFLTTPLPFGTEPAKMSASIHSVGELGAFNPDHQNDYYIGANLLHSFAYDGELSTNIDFEFSSSLLNDGVTTFILKQKAPPNIPGVVANNLSVTLYASYLEKLELCYQRLLQINEMPFYFTGPTNVSNIRLSGLSSTNVLLLDISQPLSPVELTGFTVESNAGSWSLEFAHSNVEQRCYALFSNSVAAGISGIDIVRFRNLNMTNRQVDYLVVAHDSFKEPVYRLLKHRYKNGLSVQVASPDDVYNEFSYGIKNPAAIRQYFGYSYHHYESPAPEFALLVGNGSQDPMNDLGENDPDLIPVRMGWSVATRTSIDQWFVTIDGSDILADMKLGRIPASAVSNVEHVVSKIIAFETAPTNAFWFETALLVADNNTGIDFKGFTEANTVRHLTNGGFEAFNIIPAYLDDYPGAAQVRTAIHSELDIGLQFVNYLGHGAEERWAAEVIWENAHAQSRMNTIHPIFSVFTCENGSYEQADFTLAEAIMLGEHTGSAIFAPSTFAIDFNSEQVSDGYFAAIATNRVERLGDAVHEGFFRLWTINTVAREMLFYTIFGDPAQQLWGGAEP